MSIFKSFKLKWWEAALFKVCTISLGIIVGATWAGVFMPLRDVLLVVCVLSSLFVTWVWWKQ
jgi:hypothetical protein